MWYEFNFFNCVKNQEKTILFLFALTYSFIIHRKNLSAYHEYTPHQNHF